MNNNAQSNIIPEILHKISLNDFKELLVFCKPYFKKEIDEENLKKHTKEMVSFHKNNKKSLSKDNVVVQLLNQWYSSLLTNKPDYSVYEEPNYIVDIWTCWSVYSRNSVKVLLEKSSLVDQSLAEVINKKGTIVDAGCGIAYTTIALRQAFPQSRVVGTNFEDSWQYKMAVEMGKKYNFELQPNPFGVKNVELFFASEYFEHIVNPLEHLREICQHCSPNYFVIANGFNGTAIGHFNEYEDKGEKISNSKMSRMFSKEMRLLGYEKLKTKIWNDRPSIWRKKI
jgi:hypothetical protein